MPFLCPLSVTTTIFGTFNCVNIDPSGQVPGTPKYMSNDYSIACNSSRYTFGLVWACVGILVYPVGVLVLYAYFLWDNRNDIMVIKAAEIEEREDKKEDKLHQKLLRRELNATQETKETVALKKHLATLADRRKSRSNIDSAAVPTSASAVPRIVSAAELTFLFKAYEGKVAKYTAMQYHATLFSLSRSFSFLLPHPVPSPCDVVLVLGVSGDRSQAVAHGRAVRGEHRVQRADRVRNRNSASLHETVRILPAV